jgi:hypothetical protein
VLRYDVWWRTGRKTALISEKCALFRSRNGNAMQTLIGYYLYAARSGRRAINVLNRLGITLSYSSVLKSLENNAHQSAQAIRNRAKAGLPMLVTYDNLNWYQKVRNETPLNKPMELLWTAGAVMNVQWTSSLALRLGKDPELLREAGLLLEDPNYTPPSRHPQEALLSPIEDPPRPAIDRAKLLKPNPDWSALITPDDIVDFKGIASYWRDTIPGLVSKILRKQFPDLPDFQRIPIPVIHKLPPQKTDIAKGKIGNEVLAYALYSEVWVLAPIVKFSRRGAGSFDTNDRRRNFRNKTLR